MIPARLAQTLNSALPLELQDRLRAVERERELLTLSLPKLDPERLLRLNVARIGSSNTLLRDHGQLSLWDRANSKVQQWITEGATVDWEKISQLNGLLTSGDSHASQLRDHDVYTGGRAHFTPTSLPSLVKWLEEYALPGGEILHPVHFAALARFWLVSIHPFRDGNGRTSTLVGDWILLKNGYPPFCFPRVIDGTVAAVPEGKEWATAERAVTKSLEALECAFKLLLGE